MSVRPTYSLFAKAYDYSMEHVDYQKWSRYVFRILKERNPEGGTLLELATGTGSMLKATSDRAIKNWSIIQSDLSPQMIKIASSTSPRLCLDMRSISFSDSSLDAVVCLYDSVNYMVEEDDLRLYFSECARVLNPNGTLVFDTVTEQNSLTWYFDGSEWEEFEEGLLLRSFQYDEEERLQHTQFRLLERNSKGLYKEQQEFHCQKMWDKEEIIEIAVSQGLSLVQCFSGFSKREPGERTERIQWVFAKAKSK
jgi:ubiquinone/menaquinone biosynthesis C-methylase UbiE